MITHRWLYLHVPEANKSSVFCLAMNAAAEIRKFRNEIISSQSSKYRPWHMNFKDNMACSAALF